MAETFECPQCKKEYPRENRLVGKAVACECGHRFLVPPPEQQTPLVGVPLPPGAPSSATPPPSASSAPAPSGSGTVRPAPSTGSASLGRPAASKPAPQYPPAQRTAAQKPARWTDPVPAQDAVPLTEADLVADQPPPAQAYGSIDLPPPPVAPQPPVYASAAPPLGAALPPNPYKTPRPGKSKKSRGQASRDNSVSLGLWAAGFVLVVFLPAAGFCAVMAMYRYSQSGWTGRPTAVAPQHRSVEQPGSVEPAPAQQLPDARGEPQTPSNGEPLPGGSPVTIWDGKQSANAAQLEFSLEYRLDGLAASPESKYFWIVVDRDQSRVEFPIPASVLKPRDHLSGQPKGVTAAQFRAPYQMYLERQAPGMNQRETISNVIRVTGG